MSKQIQWYPGHMSKAIRELKDTTKKVDMFFVLLDARAPESSFVDSVKEIIEGKSVTIVLTKSDLVTKEELNFWIKHYEDIYDHVISISLQRNKNAYREILNVLKKSKFKALIPKFAIIGIPNVGKSTLLNIMKKKSSANTEDRAGVTKKSSWYQIENRYWLLDTPGILQPGFEGDQQAMALAAIGSIKLDVLPLDKVATLLIERLNELGIETGFENSEALYNAMKESNTSENDFYKAIIKRYQSGRLGNKILDKK